MKQLIFKLSLYIVLMVLSILVLFFTISIIIPSQYNESFQYTLNSKYNHLMDTKDSNKPKIIVISGSSGAFGLDSNLLENKTGLPVVNLSLHAGFGAKFETEISKGNIQKGDIVVISYEHGVWCSINMYDVGLISTGIDNNIGMYKYVPISYYSDVIKYFPTYTFKKLDAWLFNPLEFNDPYSRSAFDEKGNMIFERDLCIMPYPLNIEAYGSIGVLDINDDAKNYVNKFNEYVISKGATLVISFPPVLDESVFVNDDKIMKFENDLDESLDAPIISNMNDYFFPRELMYDTIFHCNSQGEKARSLILADDLNKYISSR